MTLERCIWGEHYDCPDGWHWGSDVPRRRSMANGTDDRVTTTRPSGTAALSACGRCNGPTRLAYDQFTSLCEGCALRPRDCSCEPVLSETADASDGVEPATDVVAKPCRGAEEPVAGSPTTIAVTREQLAKALDTARVYDALYAGATGGAGRPAFRTRLANAIFDELLVQQVRP